MDKGPVFCFKEATTQIYYKVQQIPLHDRLLSDHNTLDEKLSTNPMAISPSVVDKNLYGHRL
jgi:hypothetical protein